MRAKEARLQLLRRSLEGARRLPGNAQDFPERKLLSQGVENTQLLSWNGIRDILRNLGRN